MARKKQNTQDEKLGTVVEELTRVMFTINESAEHALGMLQPDASTSNDVATRKTVERIIRAGKKGLVILDGLRPAKGE